MTSKFSSGDKSTTNHRSSKWTKLVDRGGLYHVEDIVYYLFVALEIITDKELTTIFSQKGRGIEKVRKEKLSWICNDEDVQFIYCLVSPSIIAEESSRQKLLREIAYIWVTTRGHSKAQQLKEQYKKTKAETVKQRKSLRKELATKKREERIA